MMRAIGLAYLSSIGLVFAWGFLELWARSYDLPSARRAAKGLEAVLFAASGCAVSNAAVAATTALMAGRLLAWAVALVPAAVLLWAVHDLDWRHVYGSAGLGSLVPLVSRPYGSAEA